MAAGLRLFVPALAAALLAAPGPGLDAQAQALTELNTAARGVYAKGRAKLLAAADPVIVVAFDDLVLHHRGVRRSVTYTPPLYHRLKEIGHLALGIFGVLAPVAGGLPDDGAWREDLATLARAAEAARGEVAALDLSSALRRAADGVMAESLAFIEERRKANTAPDAAMLDAFARRVAPATLTLATAAANSQLDALHALASAWRAEIGEEAWARLHVLVLGPKTPRVDNLAWQYFVAALGPGSADLRVIYTESIFDERAALDLLGVLLIDRRVGAAFYGDAGRMERDLLGDAAKVRVLRLLGKLGEE